MQEMEEASERWRTERRKLNDEIDQLEAALAEAKSTAAQKPALALQQVATLDRESPDEIQHIAEETLRKASEEWEVERARLSAEIRRLERAVAEALERASNPLRALQPLKEQFEVELKQLRREKDEVEQALSRVKTQWEQERLQTAADMAKLKRAAQMIGSRAASKADAADAAPKLRELKKQLKDARSEWAAERARLAGQAQEAAAQAQRQLEKAAGQWESERAGLHSRIDQLEQQLERVSQTQRVSEEVVAQLRQQYEEKLQAAIKQKTQLAQELQSVSTLLEAERARLSTAQREAAAAADPDAITAEIARVENLLSQIVAVIDNPNTDLSTVIRKNVEKAELDAYLKGILFTLGKR